MWESDKSQVPGEGRAATGSRGTPPRAGREGVAQVSTGGGKILSPREAREPSQVRGLREGHSLGLKDTLILVGYRTGCSDVCAGRQETRGRGSQVATRAGSLPPRGCVLLFSKARVHSASSICGLLSFNRFGVFSHHFFPFALLYFADVALFTN